MAEKKADSEEIKDKINKIVLGNRYIISEFDKLKKAVENLQTNPPNVFEPDKWIMEIKDKLEGLADLAKLGKTIKNLKPTIDELNKTINSMDELRNTLVDIKKSVTALEDLKILTSELKMTMAEIRETAKTMKMAVPATSINLPKPEPIIKPIDKIKPITTSISTEKNIISSKSFSQGPLKASGIYKIKSTDPTTSTTATAIKTEPTLIKPITPQSIKTEPTIIKPITSESIKLKPSLFEQITEKPIKREPSAKKGKTHPIVLEVFGLIKQRAQSGETADALSKIIENARDTIAKSWKWHPTLLELGTFARKLKKLPPEQPANPEVIKLLLEKLEEWKAKMT